MLPVGAVDIVKGAYRNRPSLLRFTWTWKLVLTVQYFCVYLSIYWFPRTLNLGLV